MVPDARHPPKAVIPKEGFGVRPSLCVASLAALWVYSGRKAESTLNAPKLMGR